MASFRPAIKFLEGLQEVAFSVLQTSINQNRVFIEDRITEKQLFEKGEDGKGKKLRGYARTTIRIKRQKGQPTDRTTLKDTGAFYKSLSVEGFPLALEVKATVPYTRYLTTEGNRYGIDILRPSEETLGEFFEKFYIPDLKKEVEQEIKMAFA